MRKLLYSTLLSIYCTVDPPSSFVSKCPQISVANVRSFLSSFDIGSTKIDAAWMLSFETAFVSLREACHHDCITSLYK